MLSTRKLEKLEEKKFDLTSSTPEEANPPIPISKDVADEVFVKFLTPSDFAHFARANKQANAFFKPHLEKEKAAFIATNLLWHKHIDAMLTFLKDNPSLMHISVRVIGWGNFCYEGTILQVLAMAGEFDLRELEEKEEPVGLASLLQSVFNDQCDQFQEQLAAVFPKNHQEITAERMQSVRDAIAAFVEATIESEAIPNNRDIDSDEFKNSIEYSEVAQVFREAIKPSLNLGNSDLHVIKQGFAWDTSIFAEFINQFNDVNFQQRLGGLSSNKSDFVDTVVWSALQKQSPLVDLQTFSKGICNVIDDKTGLCKQLPKRIELSMHAGVKRLNGIGLSHLFGYHGQKWLCTKLAAVGAIGLVPFDCWDPGFQILWKLKTAALLQHLCRSKSDTLPLKKHRVV